MVSTFVHRCLDRSSILKMDHYVAYGCKVTRMRIKARDELGGVTE